jgi:type II secretory pathway component GspD/PulD (secretin)
MISRAFFHSFVLAAIVVSPQVARAQAEAKPDTKMEAKAVAARSMPSALMVEVTLSRYQGEKRLSSLPYTLAVTPDGSRFNLRVGGQIPVTTTTFTPSDKPEGGKAGFSYTYRDIGTLIDVTAAQTDDGRYRVALAVEDSSVYPPSEGTKNSGGPAGVPAFRSFRSTNAVILRDGQSVEYVAATDRISGETSRISVKVTVVK